MTNIYALCFPAFVLAHNLFTYYKLYSSGQIDVSYTNRWVIKADNIDTARAICREHYFDYVGEVSLV